MAVDARVSVSAKRWRVAPTRYCGEVLYTATAGKDFRQRKYRYNTAIIERLTIRYNLPCILFPGAN